MIAILLNRSFETDTLTDRMFEGGIHVAFWCNLLLLSPEHDVFLSHCEHYLKAIEKNIYNNYFKYTYASIF
jgi:hypothetical protein